MSKKNKSVANKLKGLKTNTEVTKQTSLSQYQNSDITQLSDDKLWIEAETLKNNISISFIELGKRLVELQERYAKNKIGSFQKICSEKGWKKTEVQTLITKYKEYNLFKDNGRVATDIKKVAFKIESASQKTMAELKKAPVEVKTMFVEGEIDGALEIRQATNKFNAKEILEVKAIETEEEKKEKLKKELKKLEKDIQERERNLKKLKKEKENIIKKLK